MILDSLERLCVVSLFGGLLWIAVPAVAQLEIEDADQDGYEDEIDNCPLFYNPGQNENCAQGNERRNDSSRDTVSDCFQGYLADQVPTCYQGWGHHR